MATGPKRTRSGGKEPIDVKSILTGGLRIALGAGAGYIAQKLWFDSQDEADYKIAQLHAAPTIPMTSLTDADIPKRGRARLVMIQSGHVTPLSALPATKPYHQESLGPPPKKGEPKPPVVLRKTVVDTDQAEEFEEVFKAHTKGTRVPREEHVSHVPFALTPGNVFLDDDSFLVVKNAGADHLPLKHESAEKTPLEPPVYVTKLVTRKEKKEGETKTELVATGEGVRVNKETTTSVLEVGTRLKTVFGRIGRGRSGLPEIEPCPWLPEKCFTMDRDEIVKEVRAEAAKEDTFAMKASGVGMGLVSVGLISSGVKTLATPKS